MRLIRTDPDEECPAFRPHILYNPGGLIAIAAVTLFGTTVCRARPASRCGCRRRNLAVIRGVGIALTQRLLHEGGPTRLAIFRRCILGHPNIHDIFVFTRRPH